MSCDAVQTLLIDGGVGDRRAAMDHLVRCESCRNAQFAAGILRAERAQPVPPPSSGAMERAIAAATRGAVLPRTPPAPPVRSGGGFWTGLAVGSAAMAAAAAIAWAAFIVGPIGDGLTPVPAMTPQVTLALHRAHDVSIAVDAPAALTDAEIRVVLTGAIELAGFAEQRELRWRTDLEEGANQLTLPVIATAAGGGQLLVEVHHGQKRRTFVVDVRV